MSVNEYRVIVISFYASKSKEKQGRDRNRQLKRRRERERREKMRIVKTEIVNDSVQLRKNQVNKNFYILHSRSYAIIKIDRIYVYIG